ncbi:MAG: energy transducer TonB [Bacteroidaceae bacterium]|nr:energy transducer TonB [Bacteroidaceae bacterium]
MEIKKSPKANLEDKRLTGLLLGLVVVLAVLFVAFEWSQRDVKIDLSNVTRDVITEEEMEITIQEEKPAAPPPPAPTMSEELKIIENDADVEETVIESSEETGEAVEIKEVEVIEEPEPEEQTVFVVVEDMPKFPGGMGACLKYLGQNIKYPTIAQENGIQGRVVVQFIVNKDGSIVNPVVVRSVDPYLDKEALRVIKSMPKWTPGKQRGKAVRVKYTVPVTFRLQ